MQVLLFYVFNHKLYGIKKISKIIKKLFILTKINVIIKRMFNVIYTIKDKKHYLDYVYIIPFERW